MNLRHNVKADLMSLICDLLSIILRYNVRAVLTNLRNVETGHELGTASTLLTLCFSTVENHVGLVGSDHVSHLT